MLNCQRGKFSELLRAEECKKLAKKKDNKIVTVGRPVVLSKNRYSLLKENAEKAKREQAENEQREKVKQRNEALIAHFTGHMNRTPEQKLAEVRKNLEEKAAKARASLNLSQGLAEEKRREKIAKAELLVQKLKSGPRDLRSAAIQSEILRARDVQLEVNAIIESSIKQQELSDKAACLEQANIFLGEDKQRIQERKELENAYKTEMLNIIRDNERLRYENKKKVIEQERQERAQIDAQIMAQIERERDAIEKKRALLRKNAVEAMKMVEERKKRDAMYDEVEDRLGCVYNAGRYQLDDLKDQQTKEFAEERRKQIDKNTEILAKVQERIQNNEAERIRRDIDKMKLKFDEEEQKKRNREKEAKRQRIEAHLQEMEQIKKAKEREAEVKRFELAQRFKNSEVNAHFYEADRFEQQQRAKCVRAQLMAQEEERQRIERERKAKTRICDNKRNEQEDNFFFKYAHTLMEDANNKQRPLYPFKKVVNDYKRYNMPELQATKVPRHMVSNVRVECNGVSKAISESECDKTAGAAVGAVGGTQSPNEKAKENVNTVKAETLERMAKIDAMLAEDERKRAAKSAKLCKPYTCLTETKEEKLEELKNNGLQKPCGAGGGGGGDTASAKVRYGIEELKRLGTPAPSVH